MSQLIKYKSGKQVCEIVEDTILAFDKNLVKVGRTEPTNRQKDGVLLTIKCPNCCWMNADTSNDAVEWMCDKCRENVRYNKSTDKFYCKCGSSAPTDAQFCCSQLCHGVGFVKYNKSELLSQLSQLKPFKEINILILGETCVGKSTWINGFANYLHFDTLDNAMESKKLLSVIPATKFSFTDDEGRSTEIMVGEASKNEILQDRAFINSRTSCVSFLLRRSSHSSD